MVLRLVLAVDELRVELLLEELLRVELPLDTLRLELLPLTLRLLELLPDELRVTLELFPPTLRLEVLPLTLRLELLPLTLRLLELVLLGRSYVLPACDERLDVAGATLLTADELVPCDTLRLELLPLTLRLELLPLTLRLLLVPDALRLLLLLLTLRLDEDAATLRLDDDPDMLLSWAALPDLASDAVLTVRLLLDPNAAERDVLRLRFLSHPPPLTERLGLYSATLPFDT